MPIRSVSLRLASAAAGPLIVWGCAAHPIDRDAEPASRPLTARAGRPGFVVAAPHGRAEANTGEIAVDVARHSGFAMVVASSLGEAYEMGVREAAQGPLKLYVEIRGSRDGVTPGRIEIATAGIDRELALRVKTLAELIRDAHLRGHAGAPRLAILVEPVDTVASAAGREGILRVPGRALRVELPPAARLEWRALYTAILAELVAEVTTLPGLR